ncbi:Threonyl-tRNA synthetase [Spraguea lophii 42_110]|uniref:Threonyl-tRNA synthetase n=1 Tax=Spraguea lophii (strain 42_110) TaxID=1358809 RepID=S7WA25_SPRLO|nr:Threonyl-tRNA synthetase [Spraguea lophii 42_110]
MLFTLLTLIKSSIIENLVDDIRYSTHNDLKNLALKNVVINREDLIMKSLDGKDSIINFKTENKHENWSFEFVVNDINVAYPQKAGIFLWYTEKPVNYGNKLFGTDGDFNGIMAGVEFLGRSMEILIAVNDGQDITHLDSYDDIVVIKDSPNPERYRNISKLRIKIISTKQNFKIEIYDKDNLIYDNLRLYDSPLLKDRKSGKFFSLSSSYSKVSDEKKFILSAAKLYERNELEGYDTKHIHTEEIKHDPRYHDAINHPTLEVQHLISNVEHLMKYLNVVLGTPIGSSIVESSYNTKLAVLKQENNIKNILTSVEDIKKSTKLNSLSILSNKLSDIEERINKVNVGLIEVKRNIFSLEQLMLQQFKRITILLLIVLVILIVLPIIKLNRRKTVEELKKI